jgi:hypothetical protein
MSNHVQCFIDQLYPVHCPSYRLCTMTICEGCSHSSSRPRFLAPTTPISDIDDEILLSITLLPSSYLLGFYSRHGQLRSTDLFYTHILDPCETPYNPLTPSSAFLHHLSLDFSPPSLRPSPAAAVPDPRERKRRALIFHSPYFLLACLIAFRRIRPHSFYRHSLNSFFFFLISTFLHFSVAYHPHHRLHQH